MGVNKPMKKNLKSILFLPLGYVFWIVTQFLISFGLTILWHFLSGWSLPFLIIGFILFALPIFYIIFLGYLKSAILVSVMLSNRILYFSIAILYAASSFFTVSRYCSTMNIAITGKNIVQLPCWTYVLLYLIQIFIIFGVGIFIPKEAKNEK